MAPVAILWDMENCPVPGEVNAEDIAGNVRMALREYPFLGGTVTMFSAYGDFNHFPRKVREGCQRTGVTLIDVPNGRKDASDKAILVDMFLFALDNPPPSTIFLISGDVDFAAALHKLGQRGYTVVVAIPSRVGVASALRSAGRYVWDWPRVARGGGLVPAKALQYDITYPLSPHELGRISCDESRQPNSESLKPVYSQPNLAKTKRSNGHPINIEECKSEGAINFDFRARSVNPGTGTLSFSQCLLPQAPINKSIASIAAEEGSFEESVIVDRAIAGDPHKAGCGTTMATDSATNAQTSWVEPGNIEGLKRQLVKLISLHGGHLQLVRVPVEYLKVFCRPLYLAEYKCLKLAHLIVRMHDNFVIKGKGPEKALHLTKAGRQFARKYKEAWRDCIPLDGDENRDVFEVVFQGRTDKRYSKDDTGKWEASASSPESGSTSADEKLVDREERGGKQSNFEFPLPNLLSKEHEAALRVDAFKQDLQELLVSHAGKILLGNFLALYELRYSRRLDYRTLGFETLEALLEKVNDVTILKGGPGREFLTANCAVKTDFP